MNKYTSEFKIKSDGSQPPSATAPGVLQVVGEQRGEGEVRDQLEPGLTNPTPDVDPTQLAETPWRIYSGRKNKKKKNHC